MNYSVHKLVLFPFSLLILLLVESQSCRAQQIITMHDEDRQTNYYRYLPDRGVTTLLLNSSQGTELDLFLKFSPDLSQPIYLVMFCYEYREAAPGSAAVFSFTDGSSLKLPNAGRENVSSMFIFDITGHKLKFSEMPVSNIRIVTHKGELSHNYSLGDHADYFINFFNLYGKMTEGLNAIAASDTIQ